MASAERKNKPDELLDTALAYVAAGISFLPILCDGSKKAAVLWKDYQGRVPNEDEFRQWFDCAEPFGIGLIGGAVSGNLEQLDFDLNAESVYLQWSELVEAEFPGLIARLTTIRTPTGGYHSKYKVSDFVIPGNHKLAMSADKKTIVETRGEGGYCIAPGSPAACHSTGRVYQHIGGPFIPPTITKVERDCLIRCVRVFDESPPKEPKKTTAANNGNNLRPGDDFDLSGWSWGEILEPHGWTLAHSSNDSVFYWRRPGKTEPGWSATTGKCRGLRGEELLRVFSSKAHPFEDGKSYGKFRTFALLNYDGNQSDAAMALARHGFGKKHNGQANNGAQDQKKASPKPIRQIPPYQAFPLDALPPPVRGYVRQGAAALGCDPAMVALPVLAALASAIGNTRVIRLKRGWTEPAILWTCVVAESGKLKSPAQDLGVSHLNTIQERKTAEYERLLAEYEKAKEEQAGGGPDASEKPAQQKVVVSDITIEKLAEILEENPRGTLVTRDELSGWIGSFSKYKPRGSGSDVPNWLQLNRASTLTIDRKTGERRTVYVKRAAVCVTGGIQPGILARALTTELLDSGLAARLLLAWPDCAPKRWSEAEVDPDTERIYHDLLDRLFDLDFDEKDGRKVPRVLRLSPVAKLVWVRWYNSWGKVQNAAVGELAAAYSKLEGFAARFALVYHTCGYAANKSDDKEPIDAEAVEAGVTLARWFAAEATRIYATLGESPEERETRHLVQFVRNHGDSVTIRQLQNSNTRKYPDAASAEEALNELVAAGFGEWVNSPPPAHGGRRSRSFVLRPTSDNRPSASDDDDGDSSDNRSTLEIENSKNSKENGRLSDVSDVGRGENGRPNDGQPPGEETGCRSECRTGHKRESAAEIGSALPIRAETETNGDGGWTAPDADPVTLDNPFLDSDLSPAPSPPPPPPPPARRSRGKPERDFFTD